MSKFLTADQRPPRGISWLGLIVLAMIGASSALVASAAPSCSAVFAADPPGARKFLATSQIYDPFVVQVGNLLHPLNHHMMINKGIVGERWGHAVVTPYKHFLFGVIDSEFTDRHNDSLDAIYGNYGTRLSAEAQQAVRDVEWGLATNRISILSISPVDQPKEIFGFLRIFDGSGYGPARHDFVLKYESDPRLPMEHIAQLEGRKIPIIERDREARETILELGKYFIAKKVTRTERTAIRRQILDWLKGNLAVLEEAHTVLYVDVGSETHRELYEKEFGFVAVTDPALNGGMMPPNYVLRAPMGVLRANLLKALELPSEQGSDSATK